MTESEALCAELGITYRQLDHWTKRGYLRPVGGVGSGYRTPGRMVPGVLFTPGGSARYSVVADST